MFFRVAVAVVVVVVAIIIILAVVVVVVAIEVVVVVIIIIGRNLFFAPSIDAIHPQLSLRTQKPYTVAVWQSCSEMQHRCA